MNLPSFKVERNQRVCVMLFASVVLLTSLSASDAAEITAAEVLAKIRPVHPRLMMTTDTVAVLKSNLLVDPWLRDRYASQKKRADRILGEPPCQYELKGGDGLLGTSRKVLNRVATLAIVFRVEGDAKYRDRCWSELDAAAHFKDWQPQHFLNTAEMTAAFAIGYDWLHDAWSNEQRQFLCQAIIDHGLKPGLHVYRSAPKDWPLKANNWNVVCNGGLAMGALAIADESPEIAGDVLARGLASVPKCLAQFAPDGAWCEGPMYWGYTTLYESMYLDSLQTACGTDFGLGDLPGVDQAGWFPVYLNGPAGGAFNFADADEDREPRAGPQLLWMARRFHEPRYAQYQIECQGGRVGALEMIWGPGIDRKPWRDIPLDRYFRSAEVATMRDGWDKPKGWFIAFKAGSNTISHAHLDAGSFVLEAKGVRWAIDLGPDDYDLPGYFDQRNQRWNYYRLRAEGHNTLVLNPGKGPDQNPKGFGWITTFNSTPEGTELTADLSAVYPAAEQVTRSLYFVRGKNARINDTVKLRQAGEIWWFVQTRADAKPSSDGRTLTLTQEGQSLTMRLLKPDSTTFELSPAGPLPTSPHPPTQAANTAVTRIAVHLSKVQEAAISVLFEQ